MTTFWRQAVETISTRQFVRGLRTHALAHLKRDAPLEGLMSAQGLRTAWFDRSEDYVSRLNQLTKNNAELQEMAPEQLVTTHAKSANKKDIVTYASLLYNLEFAMSSLQGTTKKMMGLGEKPGSEALLRTPDASVSFTNEPQTTGNHLLQQELVSSFRSLVEFRTLLLNSNLAISGDGFTWLIARKYKNTFGNTSDPMSATAGSNIQYDKLFIMNTYNAGSPFNFDRSGLMDQLKKEHLQSQSQSQTQTIDNEVSLLERARRTAYDNDTVYIPLLAIDASPKAWLTDYGVFGKQEYLDRVWESIDWRVVEQRLPKKSAIVYN
ncbi:similar to Saccharomyces cerevisiae YDR347W MRP1 Mitochondrial ribosomal protein of the small subunit [Maudiozyma saulgeensis]|uniref:Similar to Saccharomyces cerevisiae YDR347W MRP1 Mitochondrial ribosomal protein of the small subunit n=1 Tax=Maudiozyma saulgeensis TaxID=1789683 RepID=A0A1X7R2E4_9SACH|nr:similar to Saccharomyces cerevisiae YDR347W MRP1 Mitochondrial ribosomal protein of the small subunit [Kazachstania saulgeensis]